MSPTRRSAFSALALLLTGTMSGCTDLRPSQPASGTRSTEETTAPSSLAEAETTDGVDSTSSPSTTGSPDETPDVRPEAFLPAERDGWKEKRTVEEDWRYWSATDGVHGFYTSPDGVPFEVVIMRVRDDVDVGRLAADWKCVGEWQVVIANDGFLIACSSGTTQEDVTPHHPPTMTRTPTPNTAEQARALLSNSPRLTGDQISRLEVDDC